MSPRRLAPVVLLCFAAATAPAAASDGPLVNLALTGSASAPVVNDGNAATTTCSSDSVTVDLGQQRALAGFGVSLAGNAASARVTIEAGGSRIAATVPVGTPAWIPGSVLASKVRLRTNGGVCVAELRAFGHTSAAPIIGHDLSFAVQEAAAGATYTDRGRPALPERILAAHGANWVRLRLWVDPPAGYSDLPGVLAMARRAKAAGMRLLLDPHYSDFWADPQKQPIPASWPQDLPSLAARVHDYTRDVLNALSAQGTPAQMLQLGNEIRNGMLWPTGQIDWTNGTGWDNLGTLLRAAAAGARDADGPTPKLVIHFDQGGDNAFSRSFFDHIVAQHVPFDVIGLSYYPFWHGTLSQLRANVDDLSQRYRRNVAVVETQYGWTLENGDSENNFLWTSDLLVPGYPATPGGQLGFASDLQSILAAVPGGRGLGVFYWQPEWIPGIGWEPGAGTPNDNLTLFDFSGRALPGVSFADPLRACREYAPALAGACAG